MEKVNTVGVIGMGFVGGAVFRGFKDFAKVKSYDIDPRKGTHALEEVCKSDFVFLCLPTPMERATGGAAVLTAIDDTCSKLVELLGVNTVPIIKSTVPIGTCKSIVDRYMLNNLVYNPEFLTEANADLDFITPSRIVLGGPHAALAKVRELYNQRFPQVPIYSMSYEEAEAVKYVVNSFLAVKVAFFNEVYFGLCKQPISWDTVMGAVLADGRIGRTHYRVAPDGRPGFGGSCLPKDLASLIEQIKNIGAFKPLILEAAWDQNLLLRPQLDWWKESKNEC